MADTHPIPIDYCKPVLYAQVSHRSYALVIRPAIDVVVNEAVLIYCVLHDIESHLNLLEVE